jgi:2-aminomuconate deaminase
MKDESIINSSKAPEPVGLYPHARRAGNLLFLSGVGPRERGSKKIPGVELDAEGNIISYDIEVQCHSVFQNIRYILEDAGSSWDKLIDVTVYLTNMKDDFATYNRIYGEYFKENQPCRTTIEINCLPTPIAIELKCIALA